MSAQPPDRRAFQRSSPLPRLKLLPPGEPIARRYYYAKLMQVDFRNDYYPRPFASPDFRVQPTAATADLMQRLGLLFQAGAAGFSILYDERRKDVLTSFLKREAEAWDGPPPPLQVWTRLSFTLLLDNPYYLNFTQIPLDFDPALKNFYFSNQAAHRRRNVTILNPEGLGDGLLLVPGQLAVPVGPTVEEVEVRAISGETVLCQPRCVTAEQARLMPPDTIPCGSSSPPPDVCRKEVYLDFSKLPEGRYTIEKIRYDGSGKALDVLSTAAAPVPFAFIDLLLTRPKPGEPGIYPVSRLERRKPVFTPVDYQLVFRRRSTTWRYYVVLPRAFEREGLKIRSLHPLRARFSGPERVRLGDGTKAFLFIARKPLPLQAHPNARLLLDSDSGVLLNPLPVASSRQVIPDPPSTQAFSDIYVYV